MNSIVLILVILAAAGFLAAGVVCNRRWQKMWAQERFDLYVQRLELLLGDPDAKEILDKADKLRVKYDLKHPKYKSYPELVALAMKSAEQAILNTSGDPALKVSMIKALPERFRLNLVTAS